MRFAKISDIKVMTVKRKNKDNFLLRNRFFLHFGRLPSITYIQSSTNSSGWNKFSTL